MVLVSSVIRQARRHLYNLLQNDKYETFVSRLIDLFLIVLIITNVAAVIAESVDVLYDNYRLWFERFEYFSIALFTLEYLARLWVVAENDPADPSIRQRLLWLTSAGAVIDLVAILPAFFNFFVGVDLRFLRILRLFRLLKLTRYFAAMRLLIEVIKKEKGSFQAVVFILLIMIVTASSGIYLAENQAQPQEFESIPRSMWWAVVTLTTVGYGDVTPVTTIGKVFGAVITILGVGIAALPAGILANGLARELEEQRQRLEDEFRHQLPKDNMTLLNDQAYIDELRRQIGLPKDKAQEIILQVLRERALQRREQTVNQYRYCPHCGESLY